MMGPGWARRRRRPARTWVLVFAALATFLVPLQVAGTASAQGGMPGTLDPTFDADGLAITELLSHLEEIEDVERLPDGKLLVLADGLVWRMFPNGSLDTSLDSDGVLLPETSTPFSPAHVALRPGGAGFVLSSGGPFSTDPVCSGGRVFQYDSEGRLDPGFGTGGVTCVNFPSFGKVSDLLVQADGRIVLLGIAGDAVGLARLSATGATVSTVTQPKRAGTSFETGDRMVAQPDGDIVVLGSTERAPPLDDSIGIVLSRYDSDTLAPDTSFAFGDVYSEENVTLDLAQGPLSLALQPDGRGMTVIADGTIDPGPDNVSAVEQHFFDGDGNSIADPVTVTLPGWDLVDVEEVTATPTGYVATGVLTNVNPTFTTALLFIPLGQEGTSPSPLIVTHPRATVGRGDLKAVLQSDGSILVVSRLSGPAGEQFLLNRLVEDASSSPRRVSLDPAIGSAFGEPGFQVANARIGDQGRAVVVQPDGTVVVGGQAGEFTDIARGIVLRYLENGALDTSFGGQPVPELDVPGLPGVSYLPFAVNGIARMPDGRLVVVGTQDDQEEGPVQRGAVQRLLANGRPDPTWNGGAPPLPDQRRRCRAV